MDSKVKTDESIKLQAEIAKLAEDNEDKVEGAADLVIDDKVRDLIKEKSRHSAELIILNTKLEQAYRQEKLAKEKYIELYNFAPSGYITLNSDGKIVELNRLSSLILGKNRSSLIKSWFGNYVSNDSQPIFNHFFKQIFESKTRQLCDITLSTDSKLPIYVYLIGVITESGNECLLAIYDITDRKQAEESLKESEERFELLFNQAPLSYQSLDINGNFIEVNQQWLDTLGYSKTEVIGKWFGDFLSSVYQDGFRKRFPIFKAEGRIHSEFEMVHKNGKKLFIAFEGRVGYDLNGEFMQTHCILQDITKLKRAEEEIISHKELLQRVIDNIPVMITYFDRSGKINFINHEVVRVLGWTVKEWETENIFAKCYPEPKDLKEVMGSKQCGKSRWNDYKTTTKYGAIIDTSWTYISLSDGSMMGIGQDITERKKVEEALRQNLNLNQTLLKTIPFGMHIVDETGTVLFQSDNLKKIFGETAIGEKCRHLYRNDISKCSDSALFRGIDLGETEVYESHGVLGNRIFEISHTGMLYEGKKAMLEIFQDITERKQTEQKLLRSEHELNKAQQITHIGSWYLDLATNDVTWSNELYKMYGFNPELPPPPYTEHMKLFTPESWEILSSSLAKTIETGVPYELELQTVRKDRSNGWMWVRGEAQSDPEGKIFGLWGAAQDISERKEREEQLKDALERATESDRLKSAFLANMSHEIRTPMNGILGFAQLLEEPTLTVDEQQEFIKTIGISGERMLNTINSIVDISKIEAGLVGVDIQETNINDKMLFTYNFFRPEAESKGLQFLFRNSLPTIEAIINTDNEKVYGILTNLVRNAIKFTQKGSIEFGFKKKGEYLEFYVKDTGIGIPGHQKEMIFERFRQVSESNSRIYEGSGLGLSICKSYVEMLGGKIWVESEEGFGSTFFFTIPYKPVTQVTAVKDAVSDQLKKLKILIVEDDEISYSLLKRYIQEISSEVLHAITGVEAVEACRKNPDIDLVLMDIRMPVMNGLEATQQIRQFNKDVIIIAQTAYGFSSDFKKAIEAGCNDNISKPIKKALLFELIQKHCII